MVAVKGDSVLVFSVNFMDVLLTLALALLPYKIAMTATLRLLLHGDFSPRPRWHLHFHNTPGLSPRGSAFETGPPSFDVFWRLQPLLLLQFLPPPHPTFVRLWRLRHLHFHHVHGLDYVLDFVLFRPHGCGHVHIRGLDLSCTLSTSTFDFGFAHFHGLDLRFRHCTFHCLMDAGMFMSVVWI